MSTLSLPRLYDATSNRETLGEAQFSSLFFLLVGTLLYVGVLDTIVFRGSWKRTATLVLWMVVYSGVYPTGLLLGSPFPVPPS